MNVLLVIMAVAWLKIAPPSWPVLPVNVLVDTFSVPLLLMPPPDVPLDAEGIAELPVNVLPEMVSVPCAEDAPAALLAVVRQAVAEAVSDDSVRLPEDDTSKMRNTGVPDAVDRMIVAPLPWTVTSALMTGRPAPPPSVVLFTAVSVWTQPLVRVTVPPLPLAAADIAEMRSDAVHGTVAARAVSKPRTAALPNAATRSTAAVAERRRTQEAERRGAGLASPALDPHGVSIDVTTSACAHAIHALRSEPSGSPIPHWTNAAF